MTADTLLTPSPGGAAGSEAAPRKSRMRLSVLLLMIAGGLVALSAVRAITGADDLTSSGATQAALQAAVPIGLAGLGGLWSERAGVVNIGLEGMMTFGTWFGAWGAYNWGAWAGLVAALIGGALGGLLHALATVTFGVDHIVSGVAINIIGLGVAKYLSVRFFTGKPGGGPTQSPTIDPLPDFTVPGVSDGLGTLERKHWFLVSDLAAILRAVCTNLSVLTIIAVLLFVGTWWVLWRTSFGLRLRSVGESPVAAESLGVHVLRYKFLTVLVSGGLAGLGGGFLAIVAANIYRDGQTGGRGYIGLAAMIFGNWRPGGLLAGAGLFGYTDAVQLRGGGNVHAFLLLFAVILVAVGIWQVVRNRRTVQGVLAVVVGLLVGWWYLAADAVPAELTGTTPYVTTLLVLAFASQRLRMPAADGQIYRKGEGQ
jgi:simple sugar transport system permease protein